MDSDTTEAGEVIGNDVPSLTCVCGNSADSEGTIAANADGFPVHIEEGEVPDGLAEWPDDDDIHTLCPILMPSVPQRRH
ncbi:hypothetical protein [Paenarthrobacter sp. C1]|uniref:hypothetical protein n=1 Tax=Paenarthrobacter sp. C1 TaxID=3400220 RepID=UPI003BF5D985